MCVYFANILSWSKFCDLDMHKCGARDGSRVIVKFKSFSLRKWPRAQCTLLLGNCETYPVSIFIVGKRFVDNAADACAR